MIEPKKLYTDTIVLNKKSSFKGAFFIISFFL
jgi:hypothetical protein